MRASTVPLLVILSLVVPIVSSSLLPRSQVCANDRTTKAGTIYDRRSDPSDSSLSALHSRAGPPVPCIWCTPLTRTYIYIYSFVPTVVAVNTGPRILSLLHDLSKFASDHILDHGDGVIPTGGFMYGDIGFRWSSQNDNNHQQTWGVLKGAAQALQGYLNEYDQFGMAFFQIFDGPNLVGTGTFGPEP